MGTGNLLWAFGVSPHGPRLFAFHNKSGVMDPVVSFETLCQSLQVPTTAAASLKQLEELRASPGTLSLVRSVLERSSSELALMHAATMLKGVLVRDWVSFSDTDKANLRAWCLSLAGDLCRRSTKNVTGQVLLAAAVATKRGWLDGDPAKHASVLLSLLTSLVGSTEPAQAWMGARLALLLVQEFDVSASNTSTALGQTREFHAVVAGRFQESVLPHLCGAVVSSLVSQLRSGSAPALDLVTAQLEMISECLAWDFSGGSSRASGGYARSRDGGGGNVSALGRVCPGHAWQGILADPAATLVHAILALYGGLRFSGASRHDTAARLCRTILVSLCTLAGDVFASRAACASHAALLASGIGAWLATPLLSHIEAMRAEAAAAGARLSEEAAVEWALREAYDAAAGLGALLRCTPGVALLGGPSDLISALFMHTADFAGALLNQVQAVGQRARAGLDAGGPAAASARSELESFTEGRLQPVTEVVQACLEAWCQAMSVLEGIEASARSTPLSDDQAARLASALGTARSRAHALYERIVSARLHIATASVLAGLDDDDPFEDERWVV